MRGPHERWKYDLRRVWECPDCHHKERTAGTVTSIFCRCQKKRPGNERHAMLLREEGARRVGSAGVAGVANCQPPEPSV